MSRVKGSQGRELEELVEGTTAVIVEKGRLSRIEADAVPEGLGAIWGCREVEDRV